MAWGRWLCLGLCVLSGLVIMGAVCFRVYDFSTGMAKQGLMGVYLKNVSGETLRDVRVRYGESGGTIVIGDIENGKDAFAPLPKSVQDDITFGVLYTANGTRRHITGDIDADNPGDLTSYTFTRKGVICLFSIGRDSEHILRCSPSIIEPEELNPEEKDSR
jgi:hypothetical protein